MESIDRALADRLLHDDEVQSLAQLLSGKIDQVGILVSNLDAALDSYNSLLPMGPWSVYTYGPETVPSLTYRGAKGTYSQRIALTDTSPQVELIEPLRGPSIFHEWMEAHGEGIHHVAIVVDCLETGIALMQQTGFSVMQSGAGYGLDGDGGYAFFDTEPVLGFILELVERPRRRRVPEYVFPQEL